MVGAGRATGELEERVHRENGMTKIFLFFLITAQADVPCGIPARASSAPFSTATFYSRFSAPGPAREIAVTEQVLLGNVPDQLRQLEMIRLNVRIAGRAAVIEIPVTSDYLMIGTDQDFARVPLTPYAAQYLASAMGMALPTPFLVDQIYAQALVKLKPQPTDWYKQERLMRLGSNYVVHNSMIEQQRQGRRGLVAGHKKDLVATRLLDQKPTRVAIYGWHRPNNQPIQPLTTVHEYVYEDYSHGVRLLGPMIKVSESNGRITWMQIQDALEDGVIGPLLNGGVRLTDARAGRKCSSEFLRYSGLAAIACPPRARRCAR